jgi:predicted DCC family thiol-disulfide oxidoreductase YuxK
MSNNPDRILFFDGVCNLCNCSVDFIIRRDKEHMIHFAPLQGDTAKTLGLFSEKGYDSLVYYRFGEKLMKSEAALAIAKDIGGMLNMLRILYILPRSMRDKLYDFVARNRYKWFGKKSTCRIPSTEEKNLFLD